LADANRMAQDLADKLTQLQKKRTGDRGFRADAGVMKEMGFTPEHIASYKLDKASRDSCECWCAPNKGFGKGCFIPDGTGDSADP
jgi:hypothetical protein